MKARLLASVILLLGQVAHAQSLSSGLSRSPSTTPTLMNGLIPAAQIPVSVTQRAPTPFDDSAHGYVAGSLWNWPGNGMWLCQDPTTNHAIWEPQPTGILPLDSVPGVVLHGWGSRKLRAAYAGAPIAVLVSGASTDVPVDAAGNLSTTALAADIGAVPPISTSSSPQMWSTGVTTLYDQTSGTALPATVPGGDQAPQISPLYKSGNAPVIAFAAGGMNWLTDYQQTQNIQNPILQTTGNYAVDANNLSVFSVVRAGAQGAFNPVLTFNTTYPLSIVTSDSNSTSTTSYHPAAFAILGATDYALNFQIPSTPSVYGLNLTAANIAAFDDDNNSFSNVLARTTGTIGSGAPTITLASTAGVAVGQYVVMAGIPAGTVVAAVHPTSIDLTQLSTAAETNTPVSFTQGPTDVTGSVKITFGGINATTSGFALGLSATIVGPALTPAQQLALRESLTDTFGLTPQVRDRIILSGDSVGAGADGWETWAPIRFAEPVLKRPYIIYNTAIAGSQILGAAPAQTGAFPTLVAPLYTPYGLDVMIDEGGINSLGNARTPAQTLSDSQVWLALARALGPNVRVVGRTLEPHVAMTPDSLRTSYNGLLLGTASSLDAIDDEASSPVLGNPNNINDRTLTVYGGGHTSPYYQSMAGVLMGDAINRAAATWTH